MMLFVDLRVLESTTLLQTQHQHPHSRGAVVAVDDDGGCGVGEGGGLWHQLHCGGHDVAGPSLQMPESDYRIAKRTQGSLLQSHWWTNRCQCHWWTNPLEHFLQ